MAVTRRNRRVSRSSKVGTTQKSKSIQKTINAIKRLRKGVTLGKKLSIKILRETRW